MSRRPEAKPGLISRRLRSFEYAFHGLTVLIRTQPNVRIHIVCGALAVLLGGMLGLDAREWVAIVLAITLVLVAEGVNTAVEFTVDLISPEQSRLAGWAKDVAAASVLIASAGAAITGSIIFLPKLLH